MEGMFNAPPGNGGFPLVGSHGACPSQRSAPARRRQPACPAPFRAWSRERVPVITWDGPHIRSPALRFSRHTFSFQYNKLSSRRCVCASHLAPPPISSLPLHPATTRTGNMQGMQYGMPGRGPASGPPPNAQGRFNMPGQMGPGPGGMQQQAGGGGGLQGPPGGSMAGTSIGPGGLRGTMGGGMQVGATHLFAQTVPVYRFQGSRRPGRYCESQDAVYLRKPGSERRWMTWRLNVFVPGRRAGCRGRSVRQ